MQILSFLFPFLFPPKSSTSSPSAAPFNEPTLPGRAFLFDRNGDGKISQKEYNTYLLQIGIETEDKHTIHDKNGDGMVEMNELRGEYGEANEPMEYGDRNPFSLDHDRSGTLDRDELSLLYSDLGFNFNESEKDTIMGDYDKDGDGGVTEKEFSTALVSGHAMTKMIRAHVRCATPKPTKPPRFLSMLGYGV